MQGLVGGEELGKRTRKRKGKRCAVVTLRLRGGWVLLGVSGWVTNLFDGVRRKRDATGDGHRGMIQEGRGNRERSWEKDGNQENMRR